MKILYIANSRIPTQKAHGIQIMNMCASFAAAGVKVELVVPTRANLDMAVADPFAYYSVPKIFAITRLWSFDPYWLIQWKSGMYIKVQSVIFMIRLGLYLSFKKNRREYVVYTRDEYLLPLLLRFFPHVVWEAHTIPKNSVRYRKYFLRCYHIVAITGLIKNHLVNAGLAAKQMLVAPDAVDVNQFTVDESVESCRQRLGLPLNKKIVMYTGHLYGWKGVYALAEAKAFLPDDVIVVFVGGTAADQKKMAAHIATHGLQDIIMINHRLPSDIPYYLKAADVLVLPNSGQETISTHFTSPLKLFEYMAAKKPIVASRLPSIQEILNQGNAVLVKPDSPNDLAAAITQVLNDASLGEKITARAFADVQKNTWLARAKSITEYIGAK